MKQLRLSVKGENTRSILVSQKKVIVINNQFDFKKSHKRKEEKKRIYIQEGWKERDTSKDRK